MDWWLILLVIVAVGIMALVAYDVIQKRHAVIRNFPVIGHFRYLLEAVGPELRQYIVTSNTEERPFSRDQRRWIYASAKHENNYFGFGTSEDLEYSPNYITVRHAAFPLSLDGLRYREPGGTTGLPAAKMLGARRGRRKAFRPHSVVNVSGMSFGSLSPNATMALNEGARLASCLHNTGEGGLSPFHLQGGDLIFQLGTAYFSVRDTAGRLDWDKLCALVEEHPVRAIEIKLSQGAKPGHGGVLPAAKVTSEIARIRGVPLGEDVISPPAHAEFHDVDSMLAFVERVAGETGLPVGIKSAVGETRFWEDLADRMASSSRGVDFITIDGGEGGTGAAPLVFTDHVALPFKIAFARVYASFARRGIAEDVVFIGSGKLGFPENAALAMALGCDMINVGREAMMAVGCIQAQRCHTGRCPTGVATQSRWLMRGLDPASKAVRCANYIATLRNDLLELALAAGRPHPAFLTPDDIDILDDRLGSRTATEAFGYQPGWGRPRLEELAELMAEWMPGWDPQRQSKP
ncbi:MAG: FMN-binding glutamate synthase family protein [Dehalococcoidia bacterium]|nr:FMN-binding glutamate synthase family protein [Dehalococcoidia bacterium]